MFVYKKIHERVEQKIADYWTVADFYEKNRESRFQSKGNFKKFLDDITLELNKGQTADNLEKLQILKTRFNDFVK